MTHGSSRRPAPFDVHNFENPFLVFWESLQAGNPTEIIAISAMLAYILVFLYGRRRRTAKKQFMEKYIMSTLEKQFSFVTESWSSRFCELICYATGRRSCRNCLAKIKLKESHDLLHFLAFDTLEKNEDLVCLKIEFAPEDAIAPIVYMLANASVSDRFVETAYDVKTFTYQMPLGYLPKSIVCMTENRECVVLTSRMISAIRMAENIFRCLHISDQMEFAEQDPADRGIVLWTKLPENATDVAALQELLLATCELSDLIIEKGDDDLTVYPTRESKQAALANRMRARLLLANCNLTSEATQLGPVQTTALNEAAVFLNNEKMLMETKKNS